jgi:cellulose synthase/poly-beta-1,6-N-acetylglucosamine synthase-like glycosyltransferase
VSEPLPTVTIVVPARPDEREVAALSAIRALDYPKDRLQVLLARGRQPSVQRNLALRQAAGELIYFLDDDSRPEPDALRRAVAHFRRPEVVMVGGPNLCPDDAPPLEQAFARTMAAWLAFGPSRARYWPVGEARNSSEKELILCNLLARRAPVLELGGFDEALYPNEENALMDELQKRGGKLVYDPRVFVLRRPRPNLRSFVKMLLNYGRGRAEQFRRHPSLGSAANFVPPLFVVYLLALAFLPPFFDIPALIYVLLICVQSATITQGRLSLWLRVAPLIVLTHIVYGLGFWRGLFTRPEQRPKPTAAEIEIQETAP